MRRRRKIPTVLKTAMSRLRTPMTATNGITVADDIEVRGGADVHPLKHVGDSNGSNDGKAEQDHEGRAPCRGAHSPDEPV